MKKLFKIVKQIAADNNKSNPEADKIIEEKFARGESFDVKFLFDLYSLEINDRDDMGDTALNIAIFFEYFDIAIALIKAGADLNVKDSDGMTALHTAIKQGHNNIVEALIKARANLNIRDKYGFTALHIAINYKNIEAVIALIKAEADLNIKNKNGNTALHYAAVNMSTNILTLLIKAGADITISDKEGKTALDYALARNKCTSAAILLKHSAPEIQENFKNTCLNNKQDNIIYKNIISSNPDYVGAYKILEVLFEKFEDQIKFLGQIDIRPDHEFVSLLEMADKYKVNFATIYSCFDKFKDIEKTEKVISKKPELTRKMGEVSYREVASLAKILSTVKILEGASCLPVDMLVKIAYHDITDDQKLAESVEKSREDQGHSL